MAAPSRLWLAGVLSPQRDLVLITALVQLVRSSARRLAILVCVDGLTSYVTAVLREFRQPVRTGPRGDPDWCWSKACSWAKWSSGMRSDVSGVWSTGWSEGPSRPSPRC
jgi:hypothetical protein